MRQLSRELVRELAAFRGAGPIVSLYLDVDGRRYVRPADYEAVFERLAKPHVEPSARDLVKRIHQIRGFVTGGFDRSRVRGIAAFCGVGLWETVELPVPVRNQLIVNDTPHVAQLEAVLDNHERIGVLLTDRQRARVFVFELGELVDKSELFDELPRHEDDQGEWRRDHVHDHQAAAAHRHVKRAADAAFAAWQEQRFEHLVLAAPDDLVPEVERSLHSYLRRRVAARVNVPVNSTEPDIHHTVVEVEEQIERDRKAELVHQLRAAHAQGNAGLAGLETVLPALGDHRVGTLLVSAGYETPGWRCDGCRYLRAKGPTCEGCGARMVRVDDVVEEAIEEAITQNCQVEVCDGNADLDVLGRIGALLRF